MQARLEVAVRELRRLFRRAGRNAAAYEAARIAVATQWLACYNDLHREVEVVSVSGDGDCIYGLLGRLVGCNPLVLRAAIIGSQLRLCVSMCSVAVSHVLSCTFHELCRRSVCGCGCVSKCVYPRTPTLSSMLACNMTSNRNMTQTAAWKKD